jgi:hypothetical protein
MLGNSTSTLWTSAGRRQSPCELNREASGVLGAAEAICTATPSNSDPGQKLA